MNNSHTLVPLNEMETMASAISRSGLFGLKSPEQALALFLVAQSEGRHPASAAKEYHIINGRPALRADAILARFQAAGGSVQWDDRNDTRVTGTFSHPQGGELKVSWSIDDAKRAGIYGNQWLKYPRQMLTARCISEGVRAVFPSVTSGIYTPEEVADFDPPPSSRSTTPAPFRAVRSKEKVTEVEAAVVTAEVQPISLPPMSGKDFEEAPESPELQKLRGLMKEAGVDEAMVIGFLNRKKANATNSDAVANLPQAIIKKLIKQWASVIGKEDK